MTALTIEQLTEPVQLFGVRNNTFVEKSVVEVEVQNKKVVDEEIGYCPGCEAGIDTKHLYGAQCCFNSLVGENHYEKDDDEEIGYCPGCEAGIDTKHSYDVHCCFE